MYLYQGESLRIYHNLQPAIIAAYSIKGKVLRQRGTTFAQLKSLVHLLTYAEHRMPNIVATDLTFAIKFNIVLRDSATSK